MDDRRLVERFEDLKAGMRVVVQCACRDHVGISTGPSVEHVFDRFGVAIVSECVTVIGARHDNGRMVVADRSSVARRRVFRFGSDLGISDEVSREENPYISRQTLGTNGVDEVRVAAKERTR